MFLFFRSCSGPLHQSQQQHRVFQMHLRTYVDGTIKWVRDRGLDHAVEREKNLLPVMSIKDFIKSEPSKSVPVSIITQKREALRIPMRPIELIRKYPSVFEEFLPGGIGIQPHVRLTSKVLELDAEELLTYQSETCRQQAADRLVRLLMLSRVHKIPLSIIDQLKWDLGLPKDYVQSIVPDFPDYFKVGHQNFASGSGDMRVLELVCWNNELATSVLEKMAAKVKPDTPKRIHISFPMKFSNGFEMDKKFKKWVDEWQKLPYISPYENASHLPPNSDESDRWTVAILHEVLHMLVTKKTEKENILCIGEYFGLRSRFKRALLHHPGIFYLSSKAGTYTVVLQEGYKRGSVIECSPLMNIRNKYLHLMNTVNEDSKTISEHSGTRQQKQEQKAGSDDDSGKQNEAELFNSSDDEDEDPSSNHNICDDRKEDGRKRYVDFKGHTARNRAIEDGRKRHVDFKGHTARNRAIEDGRKRHVDFKGHTARNRAIEDGRERHVDFKGHTARNRKIEDGRERHVDFKGHTGRNREIEDGRERHVDFKGHTARNREIEDGRKRHVDFKGHTTRNRAIEDGRKRHVDFKENDGRNRVIEDGRKRHVDFKENDGRKRVIEDGRKRHVDFKENAARNRERSSKRMNSTMEKPSRDVKRERSNMGKRYPAVRTKV